MKNLKTNEVSWFINLYKLDNRLKFINYYIYVILLLKEGHTQEEEEQQQEDDTEVNEVSLFITLYELKTVLEL